MFGRAKIYTVHEKPEAADPADRLMLVREGFSAGALVLGGLWLLLNRCWLPFCYYLFAAAVIVAGGQHFGLAETITGLLQLLLQVLLALHARDIARWQLARNGYRMTGVVAGSSELLATQRAYDLRAA